MPTVSKRLQIERGAAFAVERATLRHEDQVQIVKAMLNLLSKTDTPPRKRDKGSSANRSVE